MSLLSELIEQIDYYDDEDPDKEARECPLCTEWVVADDEGQLDCPNCGCHLESKL